MLPISPTGWTLFFVRTGWNKSTSVALKVKFRTKGANQKITTTIWFFFVQGCAYLYLILQLLYAQQNRASVSVHDFKGMR